MSAKYPATESYRRPLNEQPLAPRAQPKRRRAGAFSAARRHAGRICAAEPRRRASCSRAAGHRAAHAPQPPEPQRSNADDLFPDHKRDEQFEIPAFLRRQSN